MRMLIEGKFDRYFAPSRTKGAFWLYQHVPKTAGSSLRTEFAAVLKPQRNIHLDGTDPALPYHERLDAAVASFAARFGERPWRFASGHIFARHVAALRARAPHARPLTFLRDPSARFVSDYRYQRTPMSPDHEAFRRAIPDIDAFIALGWTGNQTARYLLPEAMFEARDPDAACAWLLDRFEFVGLQEDYELCADAAARLIGFRRTPGRRLRENPSSADNPRDVSPDQAARIAAANAFDHAIVALLRKRFEAIREPLAAWLAREVMPA